MHEVETVEQNKCMKLVKTLNKFLTRQKKQRKRCGITSNLLVKPQPYALIAEPRTDSKIKVIIIVIMGKFVSGALYKKKSKDRYRKQIAFDL